MDFNICPTCVKKNSKKEQNDSFRVIFLAIWNVFVNVVICQVLPVCSCNSLFRTADFFSGT